MDAVRVEQRRSVRMSAAYPVMLYDRRGRLLGHGRTTNISESGVYVLIGRRKGLPPGGQARIRITIPSYADRIGRRTVTRDVEYLCQIVRTEAMGHMTGLGVHFLRKVS